MNPDRTNLHALTLRMMANPMVGLHGLSDRDRSDLLAAAAEIDRLAAIAEVES